jgi:hypothetical protein
MTRLQSILRKYEEGRAWDMLNGYQTGRRDEVIGELQARFDHLAGVPLAEHYTPQMSSTT